MFNALKLRHQVLVGHAIPLVIFIGMTAVVVSAVDSAIAKFPILKNNQQSVIAVGDLAIAANAMIRISRGYLINRDPEFINRYQNSLAEFNQSFALAESLISDPQQRANLNRMRELAQQYDRHASQLFTLAQTNQQAQAVALFATAESRRIVNELDEVQDRFNQTKIQLLDQETQRAEAALQQAKITLILGALVLSAIAIATALAVANSISAAMHRAVSQIVSSSSEIATSAEQQERTANQQAIAVSQTSTTMDELGASSQQLSQQAEAVATDANQALHLAQTGQQAVGQSLRDMDELKQQVAAIAHHIDSLNEHTRQISSIISLVSDFATQTNMLALNAAVEAVRAGEQGKGFAVVASEIRKLADQSKASAERIDTLVLSIQSALQSTTAAANNGTQMVDRSVQTAQVSANAFVGVTEAINQVSLSSQQISLNIKQQAIAFGQVIEAMNAFNAAAQETAGGISQTRAGTQILNETATNLKAIV